MVKPIATYVGKEDAFQVSAMAYVRRVVRSSGFDPDCAMHVPNGGARSLAAGGKLKASGMVRGYPDIMIFAPQTLAPLNRRREVVIPRCGLALELKVWPNKPTKDQEHVHEILRSAGWRVVTCWSLDTVISETTRYFSEA